MPQTHTTSALVKPIDTDILPPKTNPLDGGVLLQTANQNSLAADDTTEDLTTPEASLSHTELEPDLDLADFTGETDDDHTSQSTLGGGTFHTTHLSNGDYADSDESQSWQIAETERGTGSVEH